MGEILLRQESERSAGRAEDCFNKAIRVARYQDSLSWELRAAATSLARLLCDRDRIGEGRALLAPIYERFIDQIKTDIYQAQHHYQLDKAAVLEGIEIPMGSWISIDEEGTPYAIES